MVALKFIRMSCGLTQFRLAHLSDVPMHRISRIERGELVAGADERAALAKALGYSEDVLFQPMPAPRFLEPAVGNGAGT